MDGVDGVGCHAAVDEGGEIVELARMLACERYGWDDPRPDGTTRMSDMSEVRELENAEVATAAAGQRKTISNLTAVRAGQAARAAVWWAGRLSFLAAQGTGKGAWWLGKHLSGAEYRRLKKETSEDLKKLKDELTKAQAAQASQQSLAKAQGAVIAAVPKSRRQLIDETLQLKKRMQLAEAKMISLQKNVVNPNATYGVTKLSSTDPIYKKFDELFLHVSSADLGHGRDQRTPHRMGDGILIKSIHRLDYTGHMLGDMYGAERAMRIKEINLAVTGGKYKKNDLQTCTRLQKAGIEALVTPALMPEANEHLLLHGTAMGTLETILELGVNPGYSAVAAFGPGTYFAEDVAKNNQYFVGGGGTKYLQDKFGINPNSVDEYALLACRVPLGITANVSSATKMHDEKTLAPIYVDGVSRKQFLHPFNSLTVQNGVLSGLRFREFVVQTQRAVLPQYLIVCTRGTEPRLSPLYTTLSDSFRC